MNRVFASVLIYLDNNINKILQLDDAESIHKIFDIYKNPYQIYFNQDYTLLTSACVGNCFQAVKDLLEIGADPNVQDNNFLTPLIIVAHYGYIDILDLLLDKKYKTDPDKIINQDIELGTALHVSCRVNNIDVVSRLINAGANVNLKNNLGKTPLHESVSPEILDLLYLNGADINQQDSKEYTPLMVAINENFLTGILRLFSYGCEMDVETLVSKTHLRYIDEEIYKNTIEDYDSIEEIKNLI